MKRFKVVIAVLAVSLLAATPTLAAQWQQNETGWWWQNDDGSYPTNQWVWLDGNGDGISESYYFDSNGYCLQNTTTPDGYIVDSNGAWTVNGVIQTQATQAQPTQNTQPDTQAQATDTQMAQVQAIMPVAVGISYIPEGLNLSESECVSYDNTVTYWIDNPKMSEDYIKDMLGSANRFPSTTEEQRQGMIKGVITKYPHNPAETIPYENW